MKTYTVIGFDNTTQQPFATLVDARSPLASFAVAATSHTDATFVTAVEGCVDALFPGESVVSAATVREQPEVFGDGSLPAFENLDADTLVDWMQIARLKAYQRGETIAEEDSQEAERQAAELYVEHDGVLPNMVAQQVVKDYQDEVFGDATDTGELKPYVISVSNELRESYTETVYLPAALVGDLKEIASQTLAACNEHLGVFDEPDFIGGCDPEYFEAHQ